MTKTQTSLITCVGKSGRSGPIYSLGQIKEKYSRRMSGLNVWTSIFDSSPLFLKSSIRQEAKRLQARPSQKSNCFIRLARPEQSNSPLYGPVVFQIPIGGTKGSTLPKYLLAPPTNTELNIISTTTYMGLCRAFHKIYVDIPRKVMMMAPYLTHNTLRGSFRNVHCPKGLHNRATMTVMRDIGYGPLPS